MTPKMKRDVLIGAAVSLAAITVSAQMGDQRDRGRGVIQKPPPPEWNLPARC